MYRFGKSSPTTPTIFTGLKKLAATAAWLAEPPSNRGFSAFGVLMESSAVEPTIKTLMDQCLVLSFKFRVGEGRRSSGRNQDCSVRSMSVANFPAVTDRRYKRRRNSAQAFAMSD